MSASAGHSSPARSRHVVWLWLGIVTTAFVSCSSLAWLWTAPRSLDLAQANQSRLAAWTAVLGSSLHGHGQDDDPLAYRRAVHLATTPAHHLQHSRTLTFDHIYVLSLPARQDRRDDMAKLAQALGIDLTFVDAADKHEPFLQWIAERVRESKDLRVKVMAEARGVAPSQIGGMSIGSDWVTPFPGPLNSSDPTRFPRYPRANPRLHYQGDNWVSHLEALHSAGGRHTALRPFTRRRGGKPKPHGTPSRGGSKGGALNVTQLLWDPLERQHVRQVHEGVISTYWGQTRAIKRMLENGDRTALILEDDVDVEWDLERLWNAVERRLPTKAHEEGGGDNEAEWDVAYLGHCWGGEYQQPQYLNPLLHRSTGPMCLHAYALSAAGARRMLDTMLDPWSAYSTAVDLVVPSLLHIQSALDALAKREQKATLSSSGLEDPSASAAAAARRPRLINSFSVVPPLVVQRKDGPSDLQSGTGSKWRGLLRDSTVERIKRDEGSWTAEWEDRYDEATPDPATVVRCGIV